jgi:regulator of microtubule dynamics protein 3
MTRSRHPLFAVVLFFLLIFQSPTLYAFDGAQGDENLMARALRLREENRDVEALELFETILSQDPDNYRALVHAAFLHFRQGWLYSDADGEKLHYLKLQDYARRAVTQKPTEYQAWLINLVAKAKTAPYLSPGDQVRIARELQQDLEALIASRKNDPHPIYMLSWLNFKVGKVSSLEKLLAKILFGGLPGNLTTGKAVALMRQAIELRPDYAIYRYDLGLFQQRLGQLEKARASFEKVLSMAPREPEEVIYRQWAEHRLNTLSGEK